MLIVGGVRSALDLAGRLVSAPEVGFRVAGLCLPDGSGPALSTEPEAVRGLPIVGDLNDVVGAIACSGADMVAVAASDSFGHEAVRELAWQLEGSGIAIALAPALTDVAGPRIHIRPVAGLPLLYVEEPKFKGPRLIAKTTLDHVAAALLVVMLSPVLSGWQSR